MLEMTIFPHLAWPAPPHFTPHESSLTRKSAGAGMGWDFSPAPQDGVRMSLDFLDSTYLALPHPCPASPFGVSRGPKGRGWGKKIFLIMQGGTEIM